MPNLQRVHNDMAAGRLWKARDRLLGLVGAYPDSQEILELLGDTYYKMGDWPEAGRYWYLTGRQNEHAQRAFEAYEERCGKGAFEMLRLLPIGAPLDKYPPAAQKRVQELADDCKNIAIDISSHFQQQEYTEVLPELSWRERLRTRWGWVTYVEQSVALIILLGPWMVGFFTLGIWLTSIVAPEFSRAILTKWLSLDL